MKKAVFVAFTAIHGPKYPGEDDQYYVGDKVAHTLLLYRWDNKFGFPGGLVDEGESLIEALGREVSEEIAMSIYDIFEIFNENCDIEDMKPLCSHKIKGNTLEVILYQIKVDWNTLTEIQSVSNLGQDCQWDHFGSVIIPLTESKVQEMEHLFADAVMDEISEIQDSFLNE